MSSAASARAAVVLATHDPQAAAFADQVHELRDGRLCEYRPDHVLEPSGRCNRSLETAGMSLSDILFLYRARLRARTVLVQECFAILGIAVGVALLFASQVASTSLARSVAELIQPDRRQHPAPARRARPQMASANGCWERCEPSPGVRVALPVLEQQANVIGPAGERSVDLIGTDPRFARFAGSLLRRFSAAQISAQQAIALPAPLAQAIGAGPLQTIKLQVGASVVTTLLGATLGESDIGGLVHSPVALAPVGYAQRITGMRGPDYAHLRPGAARTPRRGARDAQRDRGERLV